MFDRQFVAPKAQRKFVLDTLPADKRLLVIGSIHRIAQRRIALLNVEEGKLEESDLPFKMPVNEHELADILEQTTQYPEYQQYLEQEKIAPQGSWWTRFIPATLLSLVSSGAAVEKAQ